MPEIDPVILQLRADVDKYRADIEGVTRRVNGQLDSQAKAVLGLENQIRSSSGQISSSLKGLAGTLAAAFSVQQIGQMADTYTRFTNQLKVAGLEGSSLTGVQQKLYEIAQKNGVEIEAVGTLYSRAAQNQKELGASSEDLISLTKSVAASLRISGTSTQEASGALLQLGQALGSPRIQAEEFNSLLDTMQPLLREASKYIDGTGDSLAGLTRKIKDTKGDGVSNVEFFNALTQAMGDLEEKAKDADLTLSGAFTNIKNSLDLFVGQALKDSGLIDAVTNAAKALGEQIEDSGSTVVQAGAIMAKVFETLAENLDLLIEAITVLSAVMVGRFVASMVAGAASTGVVSTAIFAMQARAAGAATTMEALALAGTTAGRALLAAFGGPVGLAVTALTVGIGYLYTESAKAAQESAELSASIKTLAEKFDLVRAKKDEAAAATSRLSKEQTDALVSTANLTGEAHKLADAWARVAAQAKAATIEQARADYLKANGDVAKAQKRLSDLEGQNPRNLLSGNNKLTPLQRGRAILSAALDPITGASQDLKDNTQQARNDLSEAKRNYDESWQAFVRATTDSLSSFRQPGTTESTSTDPKKGGSKASGKTGPDPAEVARRFEDDLAAGQMAILQAQSDAIGTADARRGLEHDQINYERARNERQIKADKDTTNAQKEQLLLQNDRIAEERRKAVSAEALREAQENQRRAADNSAQYAQEALRADASLATTRQASLAANLRILDSLEAQEKLHLEAQIAAGEIADAERARADLARTQAARRTTTQQDHESPLEQRRRQVRETAANMGDAIENIQIDAVDRLGDSLANATQEYIKLGGVAGDVINSIISDLIKLQIKQAIFGSAGGGLFSMFGLGGGSKLSGVNYGAISGAANSVTIPGFAKGTKSAPRGLALIGEDGPELVDFEGGERVYTNAQTNSMLSARAAASMAGVTAATVGAAASSGTMKLMIALDGDMLTARIQQDSAPVAVEVVRQTQPSTIATAKAETLRDLGRSRM